MRGSAVFRTGVAPGGALAGPWVQNSLWTRARAVPSLDLRFADNKSLVDATTGANLVDFTRASSGTYVGSDGVLRTAVTNLLLQSEDFSTTWANTDSTEASNVETAPNGTLTADKLIPDVGVTSGQFRQDVSKAATATTYTCSVYGKAAEFNRLSIRVEHNGSTGNRADVGFSLSDGSVVSAAAALGTFSGASATVTSVGAGWYRFTLSFTSSTETSIRVRLFGFDSSLPCNGTSGIYLWGAQLEQSSTVGEYIPTTSTINSAPRFDHNPTTGESLGLLVEEARTNVVTWSQDFSQADWTKNASTVVTTAIASPIQGVNYQKIEATSANTTVGITSVAVTAATQQRAVSFFAQPLGNISRVLVVVQGADARINVNLADGTFTTNAAATGSTVAVSGQRFSVSTPTLTNATGVRFFLKQTGDTDTNTPTTIAIGEGLYLIGAQMEAGAFPTSYIPTTGAAATRSADVASITGSNFGVTRTNLLVRSEEFDNASWNTKALCTVSPEVAISPVGSLTGDAIVEDTATGFRAVGQNFIATANAQYTISVYIKAGTREFARVYAGSASSWATAPAAVFNLSSGTVDSGTGSIVPVGSGWYRCSVSGTFGGTSSASGALVGPVATSGATNSYLGTGATAIYIWGAQLEVGSAVTPYIQSPSVFTSRASSGTYVGGNGLIQTAVTNLVLRSEEFDNAAWTKSEATITANQIVAPNGSTTADLYTTSANTGVEHFIYQTFTAPASTTYTASVYAKAGTSPVFDLQYRVAGAWAGGNVYVSFNLSTQVATITAGTATASITPVGNGWFRCEITATSSVAGGSPQFRIATGDGGGTIYIWGAQLEQASTVGEYIPTTSTINSAARYDHDPISLIGKGLLLEEARTNLLLRSEEFDNAYWIKNNTAAVTPGFEAPDGSLTAFKATCTDYNSANILASPGLGIISAGYRRSVWAKVASGTAQAHILGRHDSSNSLVTLTDQWQRFEATITDGTFLESFYLIDFRGSTTQGVDFYFWGAQLEAGAFATSYIPTTTATVTRAADISTSVATSVFENSWYNQTEGTISYQWRVPSATAPCNLLSLSDGTTNNRHQHYSENNFIIVRTASSGAASNNGVGPSSANSFTKVSFGYGSGTTSASDNGTEITTSTQAIPSNITTAYLGASATGAVGQAAILSRITYWPTRLGNEVLQRITQ